MEAGLMTTAAAAEAAAAVRDGDHVVVSGCGAAPLAFLRALAQRTGLEGVVVHHGSAFGELPHLGRFELQAYFVPAAARLLLGDGRVTYLPLTYSHLGSLLSTGALRADVVAFSGATSPDGRSFSTGPFVAYLPPALDRARVVVAEVSPRYPFVHGAGVVRADRCTNLVATDFAPIPIDRPRARPEARAIAEHVSSLIGDGATLQIGRGDVPDLVAQQLAARCDLAVHSELVSDWLIDLVESGVVNGRHRSWRPGVAVGSFADGSERLYAFLHDNRRVELHGIHEVNGPQRIAAEPNLVAINSAVEVDLEGQVNAEVAGSRFLGGSGGLLDFAYAAAHSPGGKFVVALPSTAAGGSISRIVPRLTGHVTLPRSLAQFVITEYGIADLRGTTLEERARRLVAVAHPDFRNSLNAAT
jgi:acyl-CoA hydrolase